MWWLTGELHASEHKWNYCAVHAGQVEEADDVEVGIDLVLGRVAEGVSKDLECEIDDVALVVAVGA